MVTYRPTLLLQSYYHSHRKLTSCGMRSSWEATIAPCETKQETRTRLHQCPVRVKGPHLTCLYRCITSPKHLKLITCSLQFPWFEPVFQHMNDLLRHRFDLGCVLVSAIDSPSLAIIDMVEPSVKFCASTG